MAARAQAQSEWDNHKTDILRLYIGEDKSLEEVKTFMSSSHGFERSSSQYNRQFKKWGVSKNRRTEDYQFIDHRMKKRKLEGRESEVLINDVLQPPSKVRKEVARHVPLPWNQPVAAFSPITPPGIVVQTPADSSENTTSALISQQLPPLPDYMMNLPWFRFRELIKHHSGRRSSLSRSRDHPSPSTLSLKSPSFMHDAIDNSPASELLSPVAAHRAINASSPGAGFSPQELEILFSRFFKPIRGFSQPNLMSEVQLMMRTFTFKTYDQEKSKQIQRTVGSSTRSTVLQFLEMAVYLCSNNLLPEPHTDKVLQWIADRDLVQHLKALIVKDTPTSRAFVNQAFQSSLRLEALSLIRFFLDSGADPNISLGANQGTPLIDVIARGNLEALQLLLKAGASPHGRVGRGQTPLQTASSVNKNNVEMVQILLEAGASPNEIGGGPFGNTAIQEAAGASTRALELVCLLLGAGANVNKLGWGDYSRTALQIALVRDDTPIQLIQALIDAGADVHVEIGDLDEITPLQISARKGQFELVQQLLHRGADPNAQPAADNGRTALQAAASAPGDRVDILQLLLQAGADIDARPAEVRGRSALQAAIESGNIACMEMLLMNGADPNSPGAEEGGVMSLPLAARHSDSPRTLQLLLDAGANIDQFGRHEGTALYIAAEQGNSTLARDLLAYGADVNVGPEDKKPLIAAAKGNNLELVYLVLERGAVVSGTFALAAAAKSANSETLQVLLDAGAQVNPRDRDIYPSGSDPHPLHSAVIHGNHEAVEFLLKKGALSNSLIVRARSEYLYTQCTPLAYAVYLNDIVMVQMLLLHKASVDRISKLDAELPPLLAAAQAGNSDMMRLILSKSPSLIPDGVLSEAVRIGDVDLVQSLIDYGASLDGRGGESWTTALEAAVQTSNLGLVQLLLDAGATLDTATEMDGVTELGIAAGNGDISLAVLLIQKGANINAVCYRQGIPASVLDIAAENGRLDMVQLLLDAGATGVSDDDDIPYESAMHLADQNGHVAVAHLLGELVDKWRFQHDINEDRDTSVERESSDDEEASGDVEFSDDVA